MIRIIQRSVRSGTAVARRCVASDELRGGERVLVALSGGVDSAVVAARLVARGCDVHALHMRNWRVDEEDGIETHAQCEASEAEWEHVQALAASLRVPVARIDLSAEYWNDVFAPSLAALRRLRTPNPDVLCNERVKFAAFLAAARARGFVHVATGHYARCVDRARLGRARDAAKDQSYFLSHVPGHALANVHFPLADASKRAVRTEAATHAALRRTGVAHRRSSRGLCFVGPRNFGDFVSQFLEARGTRLVDFDSGAVLAAHPNVYAFTVGQRARVGGLPERYYVVARAHDTGDLFVARGASHAAMLQRRVAVADFRWVAGEPPAALRRDGVMPCRYQRSSNQKPALPCVVHALNDACTELSVEFAEPTTRNAAGQVLALYDLDDSECYGGGTMLEDDIDAIRAQCHDGSSSIAVPHTATKQIFE